MPQLPFGFQRRSPPEDPPERPAGPRIFSVSELQRQLRGDLERSWPRLCVGGELSNLTIHRVSGHVYFTLKDSSAQLRCVMWREHAQRLRFELTEGQALIAQGRLTVYERSGQLQMSVVRLEVQGLGALQDAYRQLAAKLAAEGLTAPEAKRPLPLWPRRIGVVTSRQAAALRDVVRTILRRDPAATITISPTAVQGRGAAAEIARAISRLDRHGTSDVILVVRGGGSVEDLWAFNEEPVARAIAAASIPVVTGVGHETDTTIADLVADRAASTPTAAAELAVPVRAQVEAQWLALDRRLHRALHARIQALQTRLLRLAGRIRDPKALIHDRGQRLDELTSRAERAVRARHQHQRRRVEALTRRLERQSPARRLERMRARLELLGQRSTSGLARHLERARQRHCGLVERLELLSPVAVLSRGYAVVTNTAGAAVRRPADVAAGDRLDVRLADGQIRVVVTSDGGDLSS